MKREEGRKKKENIKRDQLNEKIHRQEIMCVLFWSCVKRSGLVCEFSSLLGFILKGDRK
jgi:hypothetical protein